MHSPMRPVRCSKRLDGLRVLDDEYHSSWGVPTGGCQYVLCIVHATGIGARSSRAVRQETECISLPVIFLLPGWVHMPLKAVSRSCIEDT